jgi:hypothetical protein
MERSGISRDGGWLGRLLRGPFKSEVASKRQMSGTSSIAVQANQGDLSNNDVDVQTRVRTGVGGRVLQSFSRQMIQTA